MRRLSPHFASAILILGHSRDYVGAPCLRWCDVDVAARCDGGAARRRIRIRERLIRTAHNVEYAVIPLMSWGEHGHHPEMAGVVGTGFLINEEGYFVTAAHVLSLYEPDSAGRVPAGQRELLQIAVSGNKGNSGSPVILLRTGEVVGMIVQEIPAPLYSNLESPLPFGQSSGIMLAVPASWIQDLLKKHNVTSKIHLPS